MKKILSLVLIIVMLFSFAGCNENLTHSERVAKEGKLVVGVTQREPMNYKVNGEWTGFDTEFAQLFVKEKLGVEAEFVEITWSERYDLIKEGKIDCAWNGLTNVTYDIVEADFSRTYVKNAQMLVMKADRVGDYNDGFEVKDLKFVVEKGSAGSFYTITRNSFPNVSEVKTQREALDLVASGEKDAAVVDLTFAKAVVGEGKTYSDLGIGFDFSSDAYCVAFPKESDITSKLNDYIDEHWDTELIELANKYGLTLGKFENQ